MSQRVAVITGGFGALGSVVVAAAAARGIVTAVIDHGKSSGGKADFVVHGIDLSEERAATDAVNAVADKFGRIDVLLNIAGAFNYGSVADSHASDWESLYRVNLQTAVNTARAALPWLKVSHAARIVNVGAAAAERASAGMGPYGASKAALHRFTESLADELKHSRITVNAVLPSIIDTPRNRLDMPKADFSSWVTPDELASVMMFLASSDASGVTGALIRVCGRV